MHRFECNCNEAKVAEKNTNKERRIRVTGHGLNYVIYAEGRADIMALRDFRKTVLSLVGNCGNIEAGGASRLKGRHIESVSRLQVSLRNGEKPRASFTVSTKDQGDGCGPVQVILHLKRSDPIQS